MARRLIGLLVRSLALLRCAMPSVDEGDYADEMTEMDRQVLRSVWASKGILGLCLAFGHESGDTIRTAWRSGGPAFRIRVTALGTACVALLAGWAVPTKPIPAEAAPAIRIEAHDPAGRFSLLLRGGEVLAATVDDQIIPGGSIVQVDDRVRILGPDGGGLVAVQVTGPSSFRWDARPATD